MAGLVAPAAGQGVDETALRGSLRTALTDYLSSRGAVEHISAVSLRVTFRGQRPAINVPVGTTRYGGGRPIAANSLWQVGSNTKAVTAVMLLQLEAERKLSIHDTVGKWLPRYRAWRHITIRRLLNMTSGIPDYTSEPTFLRAFADAPNTVFSPSHLVSYAVGGRAHRGYYYSNTGYILAQMILEKATRDTYAHQLRKRIAGPLGLRSLSYRPTPPPRAVSDRMPAAYFMQGLPHTRPLLGHDLSHFNVSWAAGAGGIVSTLADLSKWERALYSGRVLPRKQQRELESLISLKTGKPIKKPSAADPLGFGLGVVNAVHPTLGRFWMYEGETYSFRVLHFYFPRSGTLIDLAVNSSTEDDQLSALGASIYAILHDSGLA